MLLSSNGLSLVWLSPHCPRVSSLKYNLTSSLPFLKPFKSPPPHPPTPAPSSHTRSQRQDLHTHTQTCVCARTLLLQMISALCLIPVLHLGWHHFQFLRSARLFQSSISVYVLVPVWATFSVLISWQALIHPSKPSSDISFVKSSLTLPRIPLCHILAWISTPTYLFLLFCITI